MAPELTVTSVRDNKEDRVKQWQGCKTWNVVYGIICRKCQGVVNVGETERTMGERIKWHMANATMVYGQYIFCLNNYLSIAVSGN